MSRSSSSSSAPPPAPLSLRGGRYTVSRLLGEGSQGATFEGVDTHAPHDRRKVAIKRFSVRGAKSWKEVELAEREARVLASLAPHPSLPRYVEHFEEADELYLVTQLIDGESLASVRKTKGPAREEDVVRFLREAGATLEHLHGLTPPLVHRDIKPSNVICRPDGTFALIDFGSVRDRLKPEGGSTVVGTFGFMAPEQFQGRALPVSDIYAAAATALAWLTGREPEDLPHRGLAIDVKQALAGRASTELTRALTAMLDPDPDRRATRIAPLLPAARARGSDRQRDDTKRANAERHRAKAHARADRVVDHAERVARRAEKALPSIVVLFVSLGLTVAQVAVLLATRVALPIVLTVLSVVFGGGLRRAARAVSDGGQRAQLAIARARDAVLAQGPNAARAHFDEARVRATPTGRVDEPDSGERSARVVIDAEFEPDDVPGADGASEHDRRGSTHGR